MRLMLGLGAAMACAFVATAAFAVGTGDGDQVEAGKKVYERANCVGCHKWSGVGGGGYGGAALSLRATTLSHEQIVEIVTCGRPGTGMPHFTVDPYKDGACYGLKPDDVKDMMPPNANLVLRGPEIDDVASYVVAEIKGKGDPTLGDCVAFFGEGSRVCDIYRPKPEAGSPSRHAMPVPTTVK